MAGIKAKDVDVAEVHDCFTIAEMMAYEDLGFAKPGKGKDLIRAKETYIDGKIPVRINFQKGIPLRHSVRVFDHRAAACGEAGEMQEDPEIGLIHNIGGAGVAEMLLFWG
jgi:acetyl-CoA C-acetyltransferase